MSAATEANLARIAGLLGVSVEALTRPLPEVGAPAAPAEPADPDTAAAGLLERFAACLAAILDEPLHTLPGAGPDGGREPLQLRLAHFRPDLSEIAAGLLEEAGR